MNIEAILFENILSMVSELTEVSKEEIMQSRKEDATDARYILVHILSRYLTDGQIAKLLHRTRQGVAHIRQREPNKWSVASYLQEIEKQIKSRTKI